MERVERKSNRVSREQKVLDALSSFRQEGVVYASPSAILERVRQRYPSRLNIPFLPFWDKAIDNLKRDDQILEHPHGDIELTLG